MTFARAAHPSLSEIEGKSPDFENENLGQSSEIEGQSPDFGFGNEGQSMWLVTHEYGCWGAGALQDRAPI